MTSATIDGKGFVVPRGLVTVLVLSLISCSISPQPQATGGDRSPALESLSAHPAYFDEQAVWSPDGTKIAFVTTRHGAHEIYVMNADGSGQVRLTDNLHFDLFPDWSPDGAKIVFESVRDLDGEIYVMDADGSNQTRITRNPGRDRRPRWTPDGRRIVFYSERDALALFELSAEAYPSSSAFLALGDAYTQVQNKAGAVAAYERALTLSPDDATTIEKLRRARVD